MPHSIEHSGAWLTVPDPSGRLASVALWYHLRGPYPDRRFRRTDGRWVHWLDRPEVDRLEYLLDITLHDGSTELVVDPENPRRVAGVFGEHSVLEFPGYRAPHWLSWPSDPGVHVALDLPHAHGMRRDLPVDVWSPAWLAPDDSVPLLLVHDGPEMERFAQVTRYSAAMMAAGLLPAHRVGLLRPLDRDAWYSASPGYARSLADRAVPALLDLVPTTGRPVLAGASLGALAALHAEWTHPGTFAGLFLASGSFFQMRFDSQEQSFGRFFRITSAVERILDAPQAPTQAVVAMVCGTGEENRENNEAMAAGLRRAGTQVSLTFFRDGHTWVGWRDALHPSLTGLLADLWGAGDGDH